MSFPSRELLHWSWAPLSNIGLPQRIPEKFLKQSPFSKGTNVKQRSDYTPFFNIDKSYTETSSTTQSWRPTKKSRTYPQMITWAFQTLDVDCILWKLAMPDITLSTYPMHSLTLHPFFATASYTTQIHASLQMVLPFNKIFCMWPTDAKTKKNQKRTSMPNTTQNILLSSILQKATLNVHQRHRAHNQSRRSVPNSRSGRSIMTHHRGLGDKHFRNTFPSKEL